jgi:hypothetical protein
MLLMSDNEILKAVRKEREDNVRFLSNEGKVERELWVAREFLTNLEINFSEEELVSPPDDPPDVIFRSVQFEIKDIVDYPRHAEAKLEFRIAREAKRPEDLIEETVARDITYTEVVNLIEEKVTDLKYAPSTRSQLDLLFYICLDNSRAFIAVPRKPLDGLASLGYRSISLLMGRRSVVLVASMQAPGILRSRAELVV